MARNTSISLDEHLTDFLAHQEVVSRCRLTPAAQRDPSLIWDFTADRWDVRQAEFYIDDICAAVERIAEDPRRGQSCEDVRSGYRRYAVGSHLLFYIAHPAGVDIIRILRQRMDPTRHF